ncbi:hypothetical protein BP6252_08524 [Coleophoma cylindrospora]|uniref:AA9 family lytic polysaccharide monooxygenase n=1 Tax=Coleophoma cylindrospora TaxID=1849047 RepID=A0A3D8R6Q5_9HELO|nr:hypothetical protein BP6252_08524 [Coleophoma cylindrospora]
MKLLSLILALAAVQIVAGHTVFTTLFVNDVDQGDGTCVRMPRTPDNATFPINDLSSDAMACGYDGTHGVARVCPVDQSSKLSFLFREWADGSQGGAIDSSHKGPCAVYMKSVASATTDTAVGDGWFKIWEETYDATTSQWCTDKLIQNNGFISVNVPSDLAGGDYLVRPEVLALHAANKNPPNPQIYTGCGQIFLKSTGTARPEDTVSIPGYVNISNPSVLFNVWDPKFPYPDFGPSVYIGSSAASNKAKLNTAINMGLEMTQTEGLLPENVVLTNANWWGVELDSYTTQDGCWNASKACWAQGSTCYDSAPPTGSKNCAIWEGKCNGIDDACNAHNFNGPPNKGLNLTPAPSTYSIPAVAPVVQDKTPTTTDATSTTMTKSKSASSTPSPTASDDGGLSVSIDATCGGSTGLTCLGSGYGDCCSQNGWCGSSSDYCNDGCQADFGVCSGSSGGGCLKKRRGALAGHIKRPRV